MGKEFEDIQIEPVIISAVEALESEKTDSDFLSLVREGIVLWEKGTMNPQLQEFLRKR